MFEFKIQMQRLYCSPILSIGFDQFELEQTILLKHTVRWPMADDFLCDQDFQIWIFEKEDQHFPKFDRITLHWKCFKQRQCQKHLFSSVFIMFLIRRTRQLPSESDIPDGFLRALDWDLYRFPSFYFHLPLRISPMVSIQSTYPVRLLLLIAN